MHARPLFWIMLYPAWLAMMALHEAGHICNALFSGGRVQRVTIPLMGFSRTDLDSNHHPLFVAWGGPIEGSLLPLILLAIAHLCTRRAVAAARLFCGFCLIANGAYIGLGPLMTAGDGHDLLRHGGSVWTLILFGVITVPAGLYLWHLASRPHRSESND